MIQALERRLNNSLVEQSLHVTAIAISCETGDELDGWCPCKPHQDPQIRSWSMQHDAARGIRLRAGVETPHQDPVDRTRGWSRFCESCSVPSSFWLNVITPRRAAAFLAFIFPSFLICISSPPGFSLIEASDQTPPRIDYLRSCARNTSTEPTILKHQDGTHRKDVARGSRGADSRLGRC